ncbi:MAG: hypothetical protein EPO07_10445 [Verrucomicrobia bacterium]|nr:MAG: hypothetical protein EPO07_10445 [Verrucomicrobiota bacterium]
MTNLRNFVFALGTFTSVLNVCLVNAQTLPTALDNTNLVWTTSPSNSVTRPWSGTTTGAYDGTDCAQSGNPFVSSSQSWLQTSVTGPGTISFWWSVSSVWPDELEFSVDGVVIDSISGDPPFGGLVDWSYRMFSITNGTHTLRWTYAKDATVNDGVDQGYVDQVIYTTSAPMPLQEALNTCGIAWTTGGNTNQTYWAGQTNVTSDGKAAESGAIYNSQESYLRAVVTGVSNVSFLWRVSSETNLDYLEFYTNGYVHDPLNAPTNYARRISGEVTSWVSNFFKLPVSATNTLTWRLVKNDFDFFSIGQNRGWVDKVIFSPPRTSFVFNLASPQRLTNRTFQFNVVGEVGCTCRVEYASNLVNWATLTNVFTTNASTPFIDVSATNVPYRFYRGLSR